MPETDSLPTIIYWAIAGPVGLFGVWLILRGLFRDRSRLPRCSRCAYDMSAGGASTEIALPATCPECGKMMKRRWQLYMTRPRKVTVTIGLALLIACLYGDVVRYRVTHLNESVATAVVPTTYWIVVAPQSGVAVFERIERRAGPVWRQEPALWFWQKALLVRSCQAILNGTSDALSREAVTMQIRLARSSDAALASVIGALEHRDFDVRQKIIIDIGGFGGRAAAATPALMKVLATPNVSDRELSNAVRALDAIGPARFAYLTDTQLALLLEDLVTFWIPNALGHRLRDECLHEVVRRKTPGAESLLRRLLEVQRSLPNSNSANFEILAALHRLRGEPDPLHIELIAPSPPIIAKAGRLPTLQVRVANPKNSDTDVFLLISSLSNLGAKGGGFRLEVRDDSGRLMPFRDLIATMPWGKRVAQITPASHYSVALDMNIFLKPLPPGTYQMRFQYHGHFAIANWTDISSLIVVQSEPVTLTVE